MTAPPKIPGVREGGWRAPRPAAYLFDLDGTLVDTAPDLMRALNHALDGEAMPPAAPPLVRHWVGHGVRAMLEAAAAHHGKTLSSADLGRLERRCLDHYAAHIADHSRPYPTVRETLAALAGDRPLAVVTNKLAVYSERLLAALDLRRFFRLVVGRGSGMPPKPDPAPARHACADLGVAAADALFVGDSATDVACARAVGCRVVVYRHGYSQGVAPEALGADAVIDTMEELLEAPAPSGTDGRRNLIGHRSGAP